MIITADDFGFTKDTNYAVLNLLKEGLITQASLMVNQPATDHAINLIKQHNLTNIGLHFNLTQGRSISDPTVAFSKEKSYTPEFIEQELEAQIQVFIDNNIPLHHLDSHHNIHLKSDYIYNLFKKYNCRIRNKNTDGFDCDGNEINFLTKLNFNVEELGTHVALSTEGLYDTVLTDGRVSEYQFFQNNKDLILLFLRG